MKLSQKFFQDRGYLFARQLASGEWIGVQQMLYTYGLMVGLDESDGGYERRFCYEQLPDVIAAYLVWNGVGDPPGLWIKEKPGDRLNPRWLEATKRELIGLDGTNQP